MRDEQRLLVAVIGAGAAGLASACAILERARQNNILCTVHVYDRCPDHSLQTTANNAGRVGRRGGHFDDVACQFDQWVSDIERLLKGLGLEGALDLFDQSRSLVYVPELKSTVMASLAARRGQYVRIDGKRPKCLEDLKESDRFSYERLTATTGDVIVGAAVREAVKDKVSLGYHGSDEGEMNDVGLMRALYSWLQGVQDDSSGDDASCTSREGSQGSQNSHRAKRRQSHHQCLFFFNHFIEAIREVQSDDSLFYELTGVHVIGAGKSFPVKRQYDAVIAAAYCGNHTLFSNNDLFSGLVRDSVYRVKVLVDVSLPQWHPSVTMIQGPFASCLYVSQAEAGKSRYRISAEYVTNVLNSSSWKESGFYKAFQQWIAYRSQAIDFESDKAVWHFMELFLHAFLYPSPVFDGLGLTDDETGASCSDHADRLHGATEHIQKLFTFYRLTRETSNHAGIPAGLDDQQAFVRSHYLHFSESLSHYSLQTLMIASCLHATKYLSDELLKRRGIAQFIVPSIFKGDIQVHQGIQVEPGIVKLSYSFVYLVILSMAWQEMSTKTTTAQWPLLRHLKIFGLRVDYGQNVELTQENELQLQPIMSRLQQCVRDATEEVVAGLRDRYRLLCVALCRLQPKHPNCASYFGLRDCLFSEDVNVFLAGHPLSQCNLTFDSKSFSNEEGIKVKVNSSQQIFSHSATYLLTFLMEKVVMEPLCVFKTLDAALSRLYAIRVMMVAGFFFEQVKSICGERVRECHDRACASGAFVSFGINTQSAAHELFFYELCDMLQGSEILMRRHSSMSSDGLSLSVGVVVRPVDKRKPNVDIANPEDPALQVPSQDVVWHGNVANLTLWKWIACATAGLKIAEQLEKNGLFSHTKRRKGQDMTLVLSRVNGGEDDGTNGKKAPTMHFG